MGQFNSKTLPDSFLEKISTKHRKQLSLGKTSAEIQVKVAARLEKEMHNQFAGYLRRQEIAFEHARFGVKTTGTVGWPDFTFAVAAKPCAVEFKLPNGKLSDEQTRIIDGMRNDGWRICVAQSYWEAFAFVEKIRLTYKPSSCDKIERNH